MAKTIDKKLKNVKIGVENYLFLTFEANEKDSLEEINNFRKTLNSKIGYDFPKLKPSKDRKASHFSDYKGLRMDLIKTPDSEESRKLTIMPVGSGSYFPIRRIKVLADNHFESYL